MKFTKTTLPWNSATGVIVTDIRDELARYGCDMGNFFPQNITLAMDTTLPLKEADDFLCQLAGYMAGEFSIWKARCDRMVELGIMDAGEREEFLIPKDHGQQWFLYLSDENGGFGDYDKTAYSNRSACGLLQAFNVPNHAAVWKKTQAGLSTWIATARRPGKIWDWDADIGHEAAHAAFSPVPLFDLQSEQLGFSSYLQLEDKPQNLRPEQIANILFKISEMAVVTVRGESRETRTGVPAIEFGDYFDAFLSLSHQLMPSLGFDQALRTFSRGNGKIDPDRSEDFFIIGVPAIRAVTRLANRLDKFDVPSLDWFRQ